MSFGETASFAELVAAVATTFFDDEGVSVAALFVDGGAAIASVDDGGAAIASVDDGGVSTVIFLVDGGAGMTSFDDNGISTAIFLVDGGAGMASFEAAFSTATGLVDAGLMAGSFDDDSPFASVPFGETKVAFGMAVPDGAVFPATAATAARLSFGVGSTAEVSDFPDTGVPGDGSVSFDVSGTDVAGAVTFPFCGAAAGFTPAGASLSASSFFVGGTTPRLAAGPGVGALGAVIERSFGGTVGLVRSSAPVGRRGEPTSVEAASFHARRLLRMRARNR